MTKLLVPDISWYQGTVSDSEMEKASKEINAIILKLGYTGSSSLTCKEESVFRNNYKLARKYNIPVGIYYYSLANSESRAKKEAEFCIKQLEGLEIDYPVYIDMEDNIYQSKCGKSTLANVCNAFLKVINTKYVGGVYASLAWFNNKIGTITEPHTKWVAQYNSSCNYKGDYDAWQFADNKRISGLGKVDCSYFYKEFKSSTNNISQNTVIQTNQNKEKYSGVFPTLPNRGYFINGDSGTQVKNLQKFLNWYGDYNLDVDGKLGSKTIGKVKIFQKENNITVDGKFGKVSLAKAKTIEK